MKLFVWEDVLQDYSSGMAIAYAETLEEAFAKFEAEGESHISKALGSPTKVIDCDKDREPFFAYVPGGA